MSEAVVERLTDVERAQHKKDESIIEKGQKTFVEVGNALARIRNGRTYREAHKTFDAYCQERWGMQRHYANRLIAGAEVVMEMVPDGTKPPATEAQARPLTKLDTPEERAEAWAEAQEASGLEQPPAPVVSEVVRGRKEKDRPLESIATPRLQWGVGGKHPERCPMLHVNNAHGMEGTIDQLFQYYDADEVKEIIDGLGKRLGVCESAGVDSAQGLAV